MKTYSQTLFPSFPRLNIGNRTWVKTIFFRYICLGSCVFSYRFNLVFGKLRQMVLFSIRQSSFMSGILHIIFMGAQKQVKRVTTGRGIALMQHIHIVGDRPNIKFPGQSMRSYNMVFSKCKCSIPIPVVRSGPKPTSRLSGFVYEFFKSLFDGNCDNDLLRHDSLLNRLLCLGRVRSSNFLPGRLHILTTVNGGRQ
jgi:hypothetical protein